MLHKLSLVAGTAALLVAALAFAVLLFVANTTPFAR